MELFLLLICATYSFTTFSIIHALNYARWFGSYNWIKQAGYMIVAVWRILLIIALY